MKEFSKIIITVSFLCFCFHVSAQNPNKKIITPEVYDGWKAITNTEISNNGQWVSYEIYPHKGDGMYYIANPDKQKTDSIPRGKNGKISPGSGYAAFHIIAQEDTIRKLKIAKKKPDDFPKDTLGIYIFQSDSLIKIPNVKSFAFPKDSSSWLVYHKAVDDPKKDTSKKKKKKKKKKCKKKKEEPEKKVKKDGKTAVYWNPTNNKKFEVENVKEYAISDGGETAGFICEWKDSLDSVKVIIKPYDTKEIVLYNGPGKAKHLAFDKAGTQLAFLLTTDTSKTKLYTLAFWRKGEIKANQVVGVNHPSLQKEWSVSEHKKPFFSDNGERIFFGTAPNPLEEVKDTIPEDEKAVLDVWSWHDKDLQTFQLINLKKELERNYLAVYHIVDDKMIQLADESMESVSLYNYNNGLKALGLASKKYSLYTTWEAVSYADYYLVDIKTGKRKLLFEKKKTYESSLSPDGKYLIWFNQNDSSWYKTNTETLEAINLTKTLPVPFYIETVDIPIEPWAHGIALWEKDAVYIYDKFDLWRFDLTGKNKPLKVTQNGRERNVSFRVIKTDEEKEIYKTGDIIYLRGTDDETKATGMYVHQLGDKEEPSILMQGEYMFAQFSKAKNADAFLVRRMSFSKYPELEYSSEFPQSLEKLTNLQAQQDQYSWGTVEMVKWKNNGVDEKGMLYKPENFDSTKTYPMIVYYYEKLTDRFHQYIAPRPTPSTVHFHLPEYLSAGYLIFVPDISYGTGHPGKDALNTVVSGTKSLIKKGFVNKDKIGLQGQSWGGYQTAYIVTQTNMFAAAMAGAPVSNMTSAYGGIRWESGMNRAFQYEQTQSRIGKNLWEGLDLYIENSPVFFADKVTTPLLIMHNDNDGAVPWYQGIEYFCALRRLDKKVWMLNYNGDQHNLMKDANRKDLSVRMKQFFDYYLQDKPAPLWMSKGLPATLKGREYRLELTE